MKKPVADYQDMEMEQLTSSDYSGLFSLSGDFIADKGEYYYKNFGFVERVFQINKGANIIWDGEPYKGVLSATQKTVSWRCNQLH